MIRPLMDKETLIQKYIHKELTEREYKILLKTAQEDISFKEELELRTAMFADFKTDMKKNMLTTLPSTSDPLSAATSSSKSKTIRSIIIISILSLLTAYLLFVFAGKDKTKNEVFASYVKEDMPQPTITKEDQFSINDKWGLAKQQFNTGNYEAFLNTIEAIDINYEQQFFKGLAHLNTIPQNFKAAAIEFENILTNNPSGIYAEESKWYFSLALIGNEEFDKASNQLQNIISEQSWNHTKAQILLSKLKNNSSY